jgi:hypothetical protein
MITQEEYKKIEEQLKEIKDYAKQAFNSKGNSARVDDSIVILKLHEICERLLNEFKPFLYKRPKLFLIITQAGNLFIKTKEDAFTIYKDELKQLKDFLYEK